MLFELRRARYGYWLALHILLLCAAGYTPTQIATVLFCSRSSVYRAVKAYRAGSLEGLTDAEPSRHAGSLTPSLRRSLLALLNKAPAAYGWCRTRWSCATLAAQLQVQRGIQVSTSTTRRWLHELGWVWKRARYLVIFSEGVLKGKNVRLDRSARQIRCKAVNHDSANCVGQIVLQTSIWVKNQLAGRLV